MRRFLKIAGFSCSFLWLSAISIFFYSLTNLNDSEHYKIIMTTAIILGIVSFAGAALSFFLVWLDEPKKNKKLHKKKSKDESESKTLKYGIVGGLAVMILLSALLEVRARNLEQAQKVQSYEMLKTLVTSTPTPTSTPDSDPIVTCNINAKCGGGSKQLRKSVCDNMTCCLYSTECGGPKFVDKSKCGDNVTCCKVGDTWSVYPSSEKCNQDQEEYNKQNTTTNTTLNYYCYNNTLKYSYYTTSGEQCNKDNATSSCRASVQSTYNLCMQICLENVNIADKNCLGLWGPAAANPQSAEYTKCINSASDEHKVCMSVCSSNNTNGMKECSN